MLCHSILLLCALLAIAGAARADVDLQFQAQIDISGLKIEDECHDLFTNRPAVFERLPKKNARLTIENTANRSFQRLLGIAHAAIVAQQHGPRNPAAAEPSGRTTSPLAWPNKEHA
jgi:hypothetical protein